MSFAQVTVASMHEVLLGSKSASLPEPWAQQGLGTRGATAPYALKQHQGGPCGLLAAVQAHLLRQLRLADVEHHLATPAVATDALVRALAEIIWGCRVGRSATVVVCSAQQLPPAREAAESLARTECSSLDGVGAAVRAGLGAFCRPRGPGVAMLLYSVLLTRGIAMVRQDADFATSLILPNGYCAQELVNLLLFGRATSNVFDGERFTGGDDGARLRGVQRTSPIGFLTLFERQGSLLRAANAEGVESLVVVGRRLKHPVAPIFVVQSEAHYSVLWAAGTCYGLGRVDYGEEAESEALPNGAGVQGDELPVGATFDLFHFDQMGERDDALHLTIRRRDPLQPHSVHAPPLEQVVNTRWPDALVEWKDGEAAL